jgi:uncharacterized membrane protein
VLDVSLHGLHLVAALVYAGGSFMLHGPLRRALRMIPPGQASIVGSRVGRDFTYLSWISLVLLGVTGYWMAFRYGWANMSAPATLWIDPPALQTAKGVAMLVMALAWLIIVISAAVITFVLRPLLSLRVKSDATAEAANRAVATISRADRWLDILALINFVLATVAVLAGAFFH